MNNGSRASSPLEGTSSRTGNAPHGRAGRRANVRSSAQRPAGIVRAVACIVALDRFVGRGTQAEAEFVGRSFIRVVDDAEWR
jgi:hypothetical protein